VEAAEVAVDVDVAALVIVATVVPKAAAAMASVEDEDVDEVAEVAGAELADVAARKRREDNGSPLPSWVVWFETT